MTIVGGFLFFRSRSVGEDNNTNLASLYSQPLTPPEEPIAVFHIGHSLVNQDMPAMLAQLAGDGHRYEFQIGWGTTLKAHWGDKPVRGLDIENAPARHRNAREAVASGEYDAIVLTEMVEIRDALNHHDSVQYLTSFAEEAMTSRDDVRLYLYETWHRLDDPEGWRKRLDLDWSRYWEGALLEPVLKRLPEGARIYIIPAGRALAALSRELELRGSVGGVSSTSDIFQDQIHLNDLGNYFVAVVHFAVLYGRSPIGLPHALVRGDGSIANEPTPELARLMQQVAWKVVQSIALTGVQAGNGE